ncbi:golgi-specific brefeldin A-resistance guanine nucleotide exchange factor 1-like isoform X2 [Dinothrombium tinctorium]|uniref:Golgi-specific brefeldin A-resistance guanine nucleotide exchange factor 1-like isoform X2 n=1 Tax=Dinothrombium tinctorium TaxID=1965070 RepID=A0A443QX76_9ACAR|nr:golgi-specific brefeldin A-resistance guanine nucleotide exchange factor 1-like isoform X2 [Dinothrombium tinctorium]
MLDSRTPVSREDGPHCLRNEEMAKFVVLGEVTLLQIALRRSYQSATTSYYFGPKRGLSHSSSVGSQLAAAEISVEAEEDEDDLFYDISGGQQQSTSPIGPIYLSLKQLKDKLTKNFNVINDPSYLKPFCEVIKNKDINGPITSLALQSILKFLNYGFIDYCEDMGAAQLIGESVTKARFEGTFTILDEVVLMRILNVLKELIVRGFKKINNETVCEIMQSCLRIAFEPRFSDLLRKSAEQALTDMCRTLFAIIDTVEDEINLDELPLMKISPGGKFGSGFGKRIKGSSNKVFDTSNASGVENPKKSSGKILEDNQNLNSGMPQPSNYGLLCIHELLFYLTSLTNISNENQNSDLMVTVGLNLLIVGFETSVHFIGEKRNLLSIVKNELCWNLSQLLQADKPINIFSLSLRLAFIIFTSLRCHLKYQLEAFIVKLMDIISTGNAPFEYREIALEYLYGFFQHINYFPHELFINYDSDPYASNLLEDVLQLLSKNCFSSANAASTPIQPTTSLFSAIQKTSLNTLLACLRNLQKAELINYGVLKAFDSESFAMKCDDSSKKQRGKNENTCDPPSPEHIDVGIIHNNVPEKSLDEPLRRESITFSENETVKVDDDFANQPLKHVKKKVKPFPSTLEGIQKLKQRKHLLWTASEQFNAKPAKGVAFLQENKLVFDENDIVNFLRDNSKLDKKQIGEYLANKKNLNILTAFVKSFEFKGLRIDEALRMYLESFRLPGEAPLISLVIEQFAHHWHESNDCPFANEDAAFSLAYAIIMLNVDQHNTNVRRQTTPMTLEEFVANLRQVNNGKDFDPKMLKEIYFAIKNNEIIMPAEQHGIIRERYLWKCLLRRSETESGIYWFASEDIELKNAFSHEVRKELLQRKLCIELSLLNAPIFSVLWGPAIAAMTFMFDKININQSSGLARKILNQGFTCCALLCARYGHLDNLIVSLCKFTMGSGGQSNPLSCFKSQASAQCLFNITREYSNEIRESWFNIIELILTWFKERILDDVFEIEDFALGGKKIKLKRNTVQKPLNKNQSEGSNFLSSFYSYFAGNQQSDQNISECSDGDQQQKSVKSNESGSGDSAQSMHLVTTYCQPLSIIEESKFLHIDSLLELIKALINFGIELKDELGDDIEAFKLEMLLQIILLNRDRVSVFWPQVSNYLLKTLRACDKSDLLTERVISAVFRLAIRFSQRPDSLSDQAFLLFHHMLVTFDLSLIQKHTTAIALHSFITHCHSCISRIEDWSVIFELLLYIGVGYRSKSALRRKEGSAEAIDVQSENEETMRSRDDYIRGYTSDSEIDIHSHKCSDNTKSNPYQLMTVCDVGTNKGSCFKILDLHAYEKCTEVLALIIKEILPKNVQHLEKQVVDINVTSITSMAVDTLRKFVEASVKIQSSHLRRNASEVRRGNSRVKNRTQLAVSQPSSESEEEEIVSKRRQQPKLSSFTEACALKLLDLMHFLHLNASFASSNATNEYLWNTIWSPILQGMALLCCDARRPVRTCALTFLQRALLNHDLRILTAYQWESCFNKVLFPLLAKLLEPLNICDPIGMDETRMRATNLLCKVFLQYLTPLLSLPTFTALWLTILDFMDKYMKADMQTDLVKEAIPESLKNMLLVMDTAQCFNPSLAVITWDRIALFLPTLKDEILPPAKVEEKDSSLSESQPIVPEETLTSVVVENELQAISQQNQANVISSHLPQIQREMPSTYPWPAPCESKFNL